MSRGDQDEDIVHVPIEESLDLHAFAPRDIPLVVDDYLAAASNRGFREIRLIHGRGIGTQRAVVHRHLAQHPRVERFWDDPRSQLGATFALLRTDPHR